MKIAHAHQINDRRITCASRGQKAVAQVGLLDTGTGKTADPIPACSKHVGVRVSRLEHRSGAVRGQLRWT